MNTTAETWPTIRSAAVQYGMSEKTIRRRITDGTLDARRFGPRLIRINPASLERWGSALQYVGGEA
ncbi:helix-turn-helix transcriptional regulator [Agrococcus beijingensis]|uniref:helix-turn-helix transcriptional regulator n=1 Tax=Agrococcus beijingensis TaxID=3068634 RepID=UPI0027426956|nr:helix-turn-helix domain-containing protein [Agrococcus sp. REN33]